jgi:tripartite-type tricarboxylate transporter receptor subunit TctC
MKFLIGIILTATMAFAQAQQYPSKPIKLVLGGPPGALSDITARTVAKKLSENLKQPIIIENRPGAANGIAAGHVAKSPADGYTLLLVANSTMVMNPFVIKDLPYDPLKDLSPIAIIGNWTSLLVVSPNSGAKTLNDFISLVKNNPGKYNYASGGVGSPQHVNMEMFLNRLDLKMAHVPYKGTSATLTDLIAGKDINAAIIGAGEVLSLIESGKLLPIATSGPQGKEFFPNLPDINTVSKDLNFSGWFGLFAPAGTPIEILDQINKEVNKALMDEEVSKRLHEAGVIKHIGPRSDAESNLQKDYVKYGKIISKLKMD